MKKALLAIGLLWLPQFGPAAPPPRPKLILAIVVDQFRYDYLVRFRSEYHAGFARLLEHGAVFSNAHHVSFPTVTAIGHSTFLSGATPSLSGIAGNEWYDRKLQRSVTSVSDDDTQLVGGKPGAKGASPQKLLVSTIGDEMKMAGIDCKVVGVSIKDRSAILPAGHMADGAYWFDEKADSWVTSSYYRSALPAWVADINAHKPAGKFHDSVWTPVDEGEQSKPFCAMDGHNGLPACGSVEETPWGNEMIEDFAEHALTNEGMGKHGGTDLLTVSFSSNDYVGHKLGPDAPEVRDISIRTDRVLGKLLDFIDSEIGPGNTLVVLTADHGVSPLPEINEKRHMPGGRMSNAELLHPAEQALKARYGEGKWVEAMTTGSIYLNQSLIQEKKLNLAEVEETVAAALRDVPHVFRVYTGEAIASGRVPEDFVSSAVRNGYFRQRSPDVLFIVEPFYIFAAHGASHGTPFNYDTHVPILFMGPGIKAGRFYERVGVTDIAPTLSAVMNITSPSGAVGRVLSEIFE